jgi:hypothetical protein
MRKAGVKGLKENGATLTRLQMIVDERMGLARIYYATQGGWEGTILVVRDPEAKEVEIMKTVVPSPDSPPYRYALITAPNIAFDKLAQEMVSEGLS